MAFLIDIPRSTKFQLAGIEGNWAATSMEMKCSQIHSQQRVFFHLCKHSQLQCSERLMRKQWLEQFEVSQHHFDNYDCCIEDG
jgi:hypothetical protein